MSDESTTSSDTPVKRQKNATYERALKSFFEGGEPTSAQRSQLPEDIEGLSARRQSMIDAIWAAPDEYQQLKALRMLRSRFGLPSDIRIISLALHPEDEQMTLDALRSLENWLQGEKREGEPSELFLSWAPELRKRVESIMLRSFKEGLLNASQRCLLLLS